MTDAELLVLIGENKSIGKIGELMGSSHTTAKKRVKAILGDDFDAYQERVKVAIKENLSKKKTGVPRTFRFEDFIKKLKTRGINFYTEHDEVRCYVRELYDNHDPKAFTPVETDFVATQILNYEENDYPNFLSSFLWWKENKKSYSVRYWEAKLGKNKAQSFYDEWKYSIDFRVNGRKTEEEIEQIYKKMGESNRISASLKTKEELNLLYAHQTPSFWIHRGLNEEDALAKAEENNRNIQIAARAVTSTEEYKLAHRHDSIRCVEYWMKRFGFSEEEASIKLSDFQRHGALDRLILKYGETEGRSRWEKRQISWQKTIGELPDDIKAKQGKTRSGMFGAASGVSMKVFIPLYEHCLSLGIEKEDIFLSHDGRHEFSYYSDKNRFSVDFCIVSLNLMIDFHGLRFHYHEESHTEKYKPLFRSIEETREKDEARKVTAENLGFEYHVVWERKFGTNYCEEIERVKRIVDERMGRN